MNTIICFRQGGNNLRLGNTLVWVEQAIDWCKRHNFTFWLPNAEQILGELCDDSSDVFSMPLDWEESIFYQSEKFRGLLGRIVQSMNEVKEKDSVSNFAFACSIIPDIMGYIDPNGNTNWSEIPTDLVEFFKKHKLVIVNDPYPFKFPDANCNKNLYLRPSKASIDFAKKSLNQNTQNIGIHIRQGDYKNWQGGRYYKDSAFYNELISSIVKKFENTDVNIFIAHNGEFEISESNQHLLKNNQLLYADNQLSDEIRDFLLLSTSNVLIAPLSTFSQQALKWGQRNNYSSGKWVPIQSNSNIPDILNKVDFN